MVWSSKKSISSIDQPMRLGCDIAYRRLSALERDNIARSRSHAVASSRDLDPGCLLALFTTSISPNPSAPAFSLPLYSSLLPDDDDTCICTCYLTPTTKVILTQHLFSLEAGHSPTSAIRKTTATGIPETHSPTIKPNLHLPLHNPTKR
jgi:hypothetical protein